ncbi:L-azetidine-2-carboxylic acid acetyltransferase [Wickerhamiella sorbophila]|uniref:L-azetidine-2-carboxylic acid acetyltransferase n=1 Tax=Wickerhamiella sorbophila TaxID=45607 RepID=A0A2T0FNE2_9ASCO|nr:L-azetidine-2-carboxylic acid acetyltransferase [Wickerhamiella sorbophila]PRT56508.1 L-azetidine-2-carboxylic acid acetyltransferase [Wickerhamiella sorbophila]
MEPPHFEPIHTTLKNGQEVTVFGLVGHRDKIPPRILDVLHEMANAEILEGTTYPHEDDEIYDLEGFYNWWCSKFCAVMVAGSCTELTDDAQVVGSFYVKPNFPYGRNRHICNAGFLVSPEFRGTGAGYELGKIYLKWGPMLGYTYSMFNMVFVTNVGSVKIWDKLGFDRIGLIPKAAKLKGYDEYIDAIQFGKQF